MALKDPPAYVSLPETVMQRSAESWQSALSNWSAWIHPCRVVLSPAGDARPTPTASELQQTSDFRRYLISSASYQANVGSGCHNAQLPIDFIGTLPIDQEQ